MSEPRLRESPARRRRGSRLPTFKHAAAYLHARIVRGIEKERYAFLHNCVRGRESLPERAAEMRGRRGFQVDGEYRGVFLPKALEEPLAPMLGPVRAHKLLEALRRTAIVFDQTEEPKRVH